ncbi:MAG: radical SAM protein [Ignavibacteria bacterium]
MRESGSAKGRGAAFNPPNRFEKTRRETIDIDVSYDDDAPPVRTTFYLDSSKTILARNDSPDLPFRYSINPYRGCEHGCIYCYARPSHEYLGFSAGWDFESKILVKMNAAQLLEQTLQHKRWQPQIVACSGNTDCYQPVERRLHLTRQCLEVFLRYRNPVGLITKNALVVRDLDLLQEMTKYRLVHVMVSITSLDAELVRTMEPRTSTPEKRLETIAMVAQHGIPVGVNVAPIIPGLTDEELPAILKAAAAHGAQSAGYILLRLPGAVRELFVEWLQRTVPDRAGKVLNRIRDTRQGALSDARFGTRLKGEGQIAATIRQLFTLNVHKYGLNNRWSGLSTEHFRRVSRETPNPDDQLPLF